MVSFPKIYIFLLTVFIIWLTTSALYVAHENFITPYKEIEDLMYKIRITNNMFMDDISL